MTIRKGQDWGSTGRLAADDPIADSDRAVAELFSLTSGDLKGPSLVGLVGGDLARTVGATGSPDDLLMAKTGILLASAIAGLGGFIWLLFCPRANGEASPHY